MRDRESLWEAKREAKKEKGGRQRKEKNWRDHKQEGLRQIGSLGNRRSKINEEGQRHSLDKGQYAYGKKKDIRYLYRFYKGHRN